MNGENKNANDHGSEARSGNACIYEQETETGKEEET